MERLNWSTLKFLAVSPALLRWRIEHPQPDSPALRLGRAIHCFVLTPELAAGWVAASSCAATTKAGAPCSADGSLYLDGKWYCRVRGHAPATAGPPPDGIEVLDGESLALARLCAQRVREHPVASRTLTGGAAEESLEWTMDGVACRGRLDYLRDYVVDLKSTRTETRREFAREVAQHLYHAQVAWYSDGAVAAGRLPSPAPTPRLISVSTAEPYDVAVYECGPEVIEAGRVVYRELLRRYAECLAAGWWPGHTPDLQWLDLPQWADGMRAAEERSDW